MALFYNQKHATSINWIILDNTSERIFEVIDKKYFFNGSILEKNMTVRYKLHHCVDSCVIHRSKMSQT